MPKDSDFHADKMAGHLFSRIARGLTRVGDARLRPVGFATAQMPVLTALKDGEQWSQSALARRARVEQPTMAQLLARMERDGIIQRVSDPADGRSSLISLTPAAQARLPVARQILVDGNKDILRGFSDDEVETLMGFLTRVLANVDALDS